MNSLARSPKQVGALIQRFRKDRGMSQTDLAQLAGMRQEQVSKVENGQPGSRLATICDLMAALDLEMTIAPRSRSSSDDIADIF